MDDEDYSVEELKTIDKYNNWYKEEYMTGVVQKVRKRVKSYKDIPLISNINDPMRMADQDSRILKASLILNDLYFDIPDNLHRVTRYQ